MASCLSYICVATDVKHRWQVVPVLVTGDRGQMLRFPWEVVGPQRLVEFVHRDGLGVVFLMALLWAAMNLNLKICGSSGKMGATWGWFIDAFPMANPWKLYIGPACQGSSIFRNAWRIPPNSLSTQACQENNTEGLSHLMFTPKAAATLKHVQT